MRKALAAAALAAVLLIVTTLHLTLPARGQVSCPSALPASTSFTGATVTEGQFKTAVTSLHDYLQCLFGSDGTIATLKSTLGLATVAFTGSYSDLSNTPATVPPGTIFPYAGSSAPTGYLMSNGQCVSSTTFAALQSAIGTGYGSCSAGTFAVPDLRGRAIYGADNMGGASAANRLQVSTNLTTTSGSTAASVASGTGIAVGQVITVTSVNVGTTVAAISGTSVTLSANATATGTNAARFSALGDAQALGQAGGSPFHAMISNELAAHTHGTGTLSVGVSIASQGAMANTNNGDGVGGVSGPDVTANTGSATGPWVNTGISASGSISGSTASTGAGAAMSTQPTGMVLNWIIKTSGKRLAPGNERWPHLRAA